MPVRKPNRRTFTRATWHLSLGTQRKLVRAISFDIAHGDARPLHLGKLEASSSFIIIPGNRVYRLSPSGGEG